MDEQFVTLDTLHGDDCTVVGKNVFILDKRNIETSRPYSIFITHYYYENGKKEEFNEYFIPSSLETIQVNFELEGGYLRIISRKSLSSKGIKPHGIFMPFSEEEMAGQKKILNVPLTCEELSKLEQTLINFNDW